MGVSVSVAASGPVDKERVWDPGDTSVSGVGDWNRQQSDCSGMHKWEAKTL